MSESDNTGSPLGGEEDAFEADANLPDDEANVEVHESKEEALRRKKIRRQLELKLERKRLREELDDFSDLEDDMDDIENLDDEDDKTK